MRYLTIRGDFSRPNAPHTTISDEQLRDLIAVEGLEILSFDGIVIDDSNAPILLERGNLKMLILWRSKLTEQGHDALRRAVFSVSQSRRGQRRSEFPTSLSLRESRTFERPERVLGA